MRFGDKAADYDRKARIQKVTSEWLSEWVETDVSRLTALEFGAGTGGFTRFLAAKGFEELVATDLSFRMVEVGRNACPQARWEVCNAWKGYASQVDRIYSSNLLQWCKRPEDTFLKWRSSMKSGGKLLASIFVKGSLREFSAVDTGFNAFLWRTSEDWMAALGRAGWKIDRWEEREDVESYANARAALKSLHALGAVEERRKGYRELSQFLKCCDAVVGEGGFPLSWRSLRVECSV